MFSSRFGIRLEDMDPEETEARRTLMEMDAPEHTRLRRLVSRPFAPKIGRRLRGRRSRPWPVEVLDSLEGEREFNFVQRRRAGAARCACWVGFSGCPTRTSTGWSSAATR